MPKKAAEHTEEKEVKQPKAQTEGSAELEQAQKELEEQKNLLLRTAAEFDNYKKRTEREREALTEYVKGQTIKSLIPSIDNLLRAAGAENTGEEYAKGVAMTIKGLVDALTGMGLEEIDPQGEAFDPVYHSAVNHVEDETVGENTVVQVYQKGYKIKDMVLRHAMVVVAN